LAIELFKFCFGVPFLFTHPVYIYVYTVYVQGVPKKNTPLGES
jgi:hypothetical protein